MSGSSGCSRADHEREERHRSEASFRDRPRTEPDTTDSGRGSVGGEDSGKTGSGGSQDRGGYSCRDRDEERYGSVTGDKNVREVSFQRKKVYFFCYLLFKINKNTWVL